MNKSNITAYQNDSAKNQMFYCKCSIKDDYYIANGDETFYCFMGKNTCFSMPELLHPEDVDDFLQAAEQLGEQPQHLILRLKNAENQYRCLYAVLQLNGKEFNGFSSFDMELCDVMYITERYVAYSDLVLKYRKFMTLFDEMFFEYDFNTDIFQIYEYRNSRSKSIYRLELETIYRQAQGSEELTGEQKAEFLNLYESVRNGREHFKTELDAVVLSKELGDIRYEFKCAVIYKEDVQIKVVGLVTVIGGKQQKKRYYLSEQAYDPGTGILNKRAIREYATDKIQEKPKSVYLAIMDIDDFKHINDTFGHLYGDEVLSRVSEVVRGVINDRGIAGRFGGDEFMIVFEEVSSEEDLRRMLLTINKHIQWVFHDVEELTVTISIGISKYPEDGGNYEELFQKADKSLYIAKAKGKNRYIIYDEQKHGSINIDRTSKTALGVKATVSEETKYVAVSEIILRLHEEGEKALLPAMQQIQKYFDIDGIALYRGSKMQRISSVGNYVNPIMSLPWIFDEAYQEYFDKQGVYMESQIIRLKNKCPEAYRKYTEQENGKFIQCAYLKDEKQSAVVAFDFFNRGPKYGTTDAGLIKILGRLIAEVLAEGAD